MNAELVSDRKMQALRRLYPGAVGYGSVQHHNRHHLLAEVRRMEGRGEIIALRRFARRSPAGGMVMPYVRLRSEASVRRSQWLRIGAVALGGLVVATGVGWLLWESRWVLLGAVGLVVAMLLVLTVGHHWVRGCPGIHCEGCGH